MKKILLLFTTLAFAAGLQAQSLTIFFEGQALNPSDTVTITDQLPDDGFFELVAYAQVKNNTERAVEVMAQRIPISEIDSTSTYFCWTACYPPETDMSSEPMRIEAYETTPDGVFSAHYEPQQQEGISIYEYVFFIESEPDDNASVIIKYNATRSPSSVNDIQQLFSLGEAYPNPATDVVFIDYQLPISYTSASVKVFNLLGQPVLEQQIIGLSGKLELSVAELREGIYLYALQVNNQTVSTRKLVKRN